MADCNFPPSIREGQDVAFRTGIADREITPYVQSVIQAKQRPLAGVVDLSHRLKLRIQNDDPIHSTRTTGRLTSSCMSTTGSHWPCTRKLHVWLRWTGARSGSRTLPVSGARYNSLRVGWGTGVGAPGGPVSDPRIRTGTTKGPIFRQPRHRTAVLERSPPSVRAPSAPGRRSSIAAATYLRGR
jgi:hypothetical protein